MRPVTILTDQTAECKHFYDRNCGQCAIRLARLILSLDVRCSGVWAQFGEGNKGGVNKVESI